jgi:hypothetical protein
MRAGGVGVSDIMEVDQIASYWMGSLGSMMRFL